MHQSPIGVKAQGDCRSRIIRHHVRSLFSVIVGTNGTCTHDALLLIVPLFEHTLFQFNCVLDKNE